MDPDELWDAREQWCQLQKRIEDLEEVNRKKVSLPSFESVSYILEGKSVSYTLEGRRSCSNKIVAIKWLRSITGWGLKDSKDAIDKLYEDAQNSAVDPRIQKIRDMLNP
jgi:ribosomal protein L7/L12